jgi:hypothetical protein
MFGRKVKPDYVDEDTRAALVAAHDAVVVQIDDVVARARSFDLTGSSALTEKQIEALTSVIMRFEAHRNVTLVRLDRLRSSPISLAEVLAEVEAVHRDTAEAEDVIRGAAADAAFASLTDATLKKIDAPNQ